MSTKVLSIVCALLLLGSISTESFAYGNSFADRHPRRAEVLRRDNRINNQINSDKGQLGGHYKQLSNEDRAIRRQERRDARMNGGHITKGEQNQLNREENRLNRQVRRDNH